MGVDPGQYSVRLHRYRDSRPIGLIWRAGDHRGEVSTGTKDEIQAQRAAGILEAQLAEGIIPGRSEGVFITWADFRKRYELEWLETLSYGSQKGWKQAADHFERICNPARLADVNKAMLSRYRSELERRGISPHSVRSYYAALRAGLGWAVSVDLLDSVPQVRQRKPRRQHRTIRQRVPTAEEFDRMLDAVPKVRPDDYAAFQQFMRGLWWSSLRIDELARLTFQPSPLYLDTAARLIVFLGGHKNATDAYLPAPPEFWDLVDPGATGPVFAIPGRWGGQMTTANIGKQISKIGRKAGVVISGKKFASAHDLRAACLTRIASQAKQSHLQALARHADPKTTSQFYLRHEARHLARVMGWE